MTKEAIDYWLSRNKEFIEQQQSNIVRNKRRITVAKDPMESRTLELENTLSTYMIEHLKQAESIVHSIGT
jgi:hypothetical protein